jgi:hypothetical protein
MAAPAHWRMALDAEDPGLSGGRKLAIYQDAIEDGTWSEFMAIDNKGWN